MNWGELASRTGSGAAAGSAFSPYGALIGGAIGAGSYFLDGDSEESDPAADWAAAVDTAGRNYTAAQQNALSPYKEMANTGAAKSALQNYRDALESYDPNKFAVTGAGQMTATNPADTWEQFLSPAMQSAIDSSTKSVQESAAGRGGLYSGATQKKIVSGASDTAMKYVGDAMDRAANQAQSEQNVAAQNWNQLLQQSQNNSGLANQQTQNLGLSYDAAMQPINAYTSGLSDINKTIYSGKTGMANTALQAQLAQSGQPGTWDQLLGGANSLISAFGKK